MNDVTSGEYWPGKKAKVSAGKEFFKETTIPKTFQLSLVSEQLCVSRCIFDAINIAGYANSEKPKRNWDLAARRAYESFCNVGGIGEGPV
jgi:hypothetical protein